MNDPNRLTTRFEIAVEDFCRSTFDLQANKAAFQARFAASVIAEFGLSRVYREVHLMRSQLAELVSTETLVGFEKGNELFPDLGVSWEEAIDARHTTARGEGRGAGWILEQFGIITEFKVTSSTGKSTPPSAIRRDIMKLGLFAEAHRNCAGGSNPLATYMVILDNHRGDRGSTSKYRSERVESLLERVSRDWPTSAPEPVVLVGSDTGTARYSGWISV